MKVTCKWFQWRKKDDKPTKLKIPRYKLINHGKTEKLLKRTNSSIKSLHLKGEHWNWSFQTYAACYIMKGNLKEQLRSRWNQNFDQQKGTWIESELYFMHHYTIDIRQWIYFCMYNFADMLLLQLQLYCAWFICMLFQKNGGKKTVFRGGNQQQLFSNFCTRKSLTFQ